MRSDQFLNSKARPLGDNAEVRRKLIVVADEDFAGLALDLYSIFSSKQILDRVLNRLVVGDSPVAERQSGINAGPVSGPFESTEHWATKS